MSSKLYTLLLFCDARSQQSNFLYKVFAIYGDYSKRKDDASIEYAHSFVTHHQSLCSYKIIKALFLGSLDNIKFERTSKMVGWFLFAAQKISNRIIKNLRYIPNIYNNISGAVTRFNFEPPKYWPYRFSVSNAPPPAELCFHE